MSNPQTPPPPTGAPVQVPPSQPAPPQQPQPPRPLYQQPMATQLAPGKHKVHSSYVWLQSITVIVSLLIVSAVSIVPIFIEEGLFRQQNAAQGLFVLALIGVGVLVLLGLIIGLQILSYKHLSFEFTSSEFNLYSGIITKKRVHVPYQRVQSVNHNATLIQRIAGVCSVSIETAGGASNKAIRVPYVQTVVAEQIRTELFTRKAATLSQGTAPTTSPCHSARSEAQSQNLMGDSTNPSLDSATTSYGYAQNDRIFAPPPPSSSPINLPAPAASAKSVPATNILDQAVGGFATERGVFGGTAYQTGAVSYEYRLTNKELILSAISNSSSGVAIILAAVFTIMGIIGSDVINALASMMMAEIDGLSAASSLTNAVVQRAVAPVVIGTIAIIILGWLIGTAATCISYGGFHACRRDSRIEVQRGLIQHQFSGMDIQRVQSVVIRQSFIRRCIGYCELSLGRIDSANPSNEQNQQNNLPSKGLVIHPFVKLNKVPEILAGLAPEYADLPTQAITLPKVAQRRVIIRKIFWANWAFWTVLCVAATQITLHLLAGFGLLGSAASTQTALSITNNIAIICYVLYVLISVGNVISGILWYRTSSFAYNKHFMTIKNGGLRTESTSFPRQKIQFGYTRTNPFQHLAKVSTINVITAAGIAGTTTHLMDVQTTQATAWLTWLKPGGNTNL